MKRKAGDLCEIRTYKDEKGRELLDEVVVGDFPRKPKQPFESVCVHVEKMSKSHWWMRINYPGGSVDVNFWTERPKKGGSAATIRARAERNL